MGPMGYGRGMMSLGGMMRGMGGGYGGYNPYQQQMGRMQQMGGYGAPPQQMGSSMRPIGPEGMGGAADANAQGMAAHQAAEAQKQQLMAQGMSEEDAHRGAMDTYSQMRTAQGSSSFGPASGNMQNAAGAMAGAMPQQGGGPGMIGAPAQFPGQGPGQGWGWQGAAGSMGAGTGGAAGAFGPSSGNMMGAAGNMAAAYGAPARGMGMGGWGGPMSLGALARMGMFRR